MPDLPKCGLCQTVRPLCDSHIIPEFAYKAIYDEKHRIVIFSPLDHAKTGVAQKGIRSRLLCSDCEQLINDDFEKPFLKYWIGQNPTTQVVSDDVTFLTGIDYVSFKLFHLSILFRASLSDHPNFSEVDLGPHEDRIRRMLLSNDSGEPWQYLIVGAGIEGRPGEVLENLIGPAHRFRYENHWGYYFTFLGFQWFYYVSSHRAVELEEIALQPNGQLPVMLAPFQALRHYRAMQVRRS